MQWALECLWWQLKFEMMTPEETKVDNLDKDKKGCLGFLHKFVGRFAIHRLMLAWASDLSRASEDTKKLGEAIVELLSCFSDYPTYEREFEPPDTEEAMEQEIDHFAKCKKKFPSMTELRIMEFSYDLMSGVHDEAIQKVMQASASGDPVRIDGVDW